MVRAGLIFHYAPGERERGRGGGGGYEGRAVVVWYNVKDTVIVGKVIDHFIITL